MTEPNLYDAGFKDGLNLGYDVGFKDGFKEAQARIEELEAENKNLRYMIIDQIEGAGDDPEIMAASRAEWAARAKTAEAKLAKAEWLLVDATVQLEEGKIKTRRNRAALIRQFLAELTGGNNDN